MYDTATVAVPVPKGYVASGVDGEHSVNTGFVIYEGDTAVTTDNAWNESCIRNQWVWVPVPDVSRIYEVDENGKKKSKLYEYSSTGRTERRHIYENEPGVATEYDNEKLFSEYKLQGMTREKLLHEIQKEFEFTIESIKRYGGFYIGRYETGNLSEKVPVVQRMNTDINNQNWYTEYSRLQRLGANGNVKSNMIWGCLWDETLQWLVDSGNKTYENMINSNSWGNYRHAYFTYKNISGSTSTKSSSSSVIIPSGSTEYSKANNIYDMAGNVGDWTLETVDSGYIFRGGAYGYSGFDYPVFNRYNRPPNAESIYYGFRAYLYIK